eukprot:Transcript_18817.p1 GENE.Transcript_18817~~Transcript_18817.p1  ORF type:complete len:641 (-),score=239.75 Transcript_18817:135-2057(-)
MSVDLKTVQIQESRRKEPAHGSSRAISLKAMEQVVDLVRTESSNEVLVELSHGRSPAGYREGFDIEPTAAAAATAQLRAQWFSDEATSLFKQPLVALFVRRHLQTTSSSRRRPVALLDLMDELVEWATLPPAKREAQAAGLLQRFEQLAPTSVATGRRGSWPSIRRPSSFRRSDEPRRASSKLSVSVESWQACARELRAAPAANTDAVPRGGLPAAHFEPALQLIGRELRAACGDFLQSSACATCGAYLALLDRGVTHASFNHVRPIGKGGYGQVWASIKRDSGAGYAIKVMGRRRVVGKRAESHLLSELRCMKLVSSDFVCALHYAYATPDQLCLVLEWLRGGSLQFHLKQRRQDVDRKGRATPFLEQEVRFYAACIVLGLEAMHSAQIVYRDLKPDNLLLSCTGYIKLTDLGMAQAVPKGGTVSGKSGTRGFWPPEMIRRQPYRFEPDWWTMGVTLHCLLATHSPFSLEEAIKRGMPGTRPAPHKDDLDARKALHDRVVLDHTPSPPPAASEPLAHFLAALLTKDKRHRLGTAGGAHQVMAHAFFEEMDWVALRAGLLPPPIVPSTDAVHAGSIAEVGEVEQPQLELDDAHFERFSSWDYRNPELMQREIVTAVRSDLSEQAAREAGSGASRSGCVIA